MSEAKQAVVDDTKAPAAPVVAVDNARDDVDPLDQLLSEYDQGTRKTDTVTPPEPKQTPIPDDLMQEFRLLKAEVAEVRGEKNEKAVADTVKAIRGDVPEELYDDEMIGAWLDVQARKDARLITAFNQRAQNPKQWAKVQVELSKALAKKAGRQVDRGATEDREAVAAAVRGASTKASPDRPANYGHMPASEGRKDVIEKYGFDPGWR